MRSVGEIIKTARKTKGLKLDEVALATKIRKEFLLAIETNNFEELESKAITRGLIKNYAEYLGLPSDSVIAIFKRDFVGDKEKTDFNCKSTFCWTPKMTVAVSVGAVALLIIIYLVKQYLSLESAPY